MRNADSWWEGRVTRGESYIRRLAILGLCVIDGDIFVSVESGRQNVNNATN